jgi:benzoyl-CoA reductase subunit C
VAVLEKFRDIVKSPHAYARNWKSETGSRVLGYVCTNVPEEIPYAAGLLPIRLLGANKPENVTAPHIFQGGFCSFCRDCFAQVLLGQYDYLSGLVFAVCCSHARQIYNGWQKQNPGLFSHEIYLPAYAHIPSAKETVAAQLEEFKSSLEKWIGTFIDDGKLGQAIDVYNSNRRLMAKVHDLRQADDPPLTASEMAEIEMAGFLIDKKTHNRLLNEFLSELDGHKGGAGKGPRLMLLGSIGNIEAIGLIESFGARVVTDDYCTGARYYQTEVSREGSPLSAIAQRIVEKPQCPLKDMPERRRLPYLAKRADDFRVQGVIYSIQRQCDSHGLDYPVTEALFREKGIPMLKLELDQSVPAGQLRTRIEAFLEMIGS